MDSLELVVAACLARRCLGQRGAKKVAPVAGARLRVIEGRAAVAVPTPPEPWRFQTDCVDAYVRSWVARGFSPVTVDNDIGVLERMLSALGRPAWEVTAEDIDRVVGAMAVDGKASTTRRDYVQVFKGFIAS
jgi:hypothetical protein